MKILAFGNPPWANSGYGKNLRNILGRLKDKHEVGVLCNWGLMGSKLTWEGIPCYPLSIPRGKGSMDSMVRETLKTLPRLMLKENYDVAVLHFDIWSSNDLLMKLTAPWISYAPVDSDPVSPLFIDAIHSAQEMVTFCDWAGKLMRSYGIKNTVIPHGVDTKIYNPPKDNEHKKECRTRFGIPEDVVVFTICGVNRGSRKGMHNMLEAFGHFLANNNDARDKVRLYIHAEPTGFDNGFHLINLAQLFGISESVIFTGPEDYAELSEERMADLFRASDVLLQCSHAEGFGLPILEAAACGVPVVVTDYTCMSELAKGHGMKVRAITKELQPRNYNYSAVPFLDDMVQAITDYYNDETLRKKHSEKAAKWAKDGYDYDEVIIPMWEKYFKEYEERYLKGE